MHPEFPSVFCPGDTKQMSPPSGPIDASPHNCAVYWVLCSWKFSGLSRCGCRISSQDLPTLYQQRCGHTGDPVTGQMHGLSEPTTDLLAELSNHGKHCRNTVRRLCRFWASVPLDQKYQQAFTSQPQLTHTPGNRHNPLRNRARPRPPPLRPISPGNSRHQPSAKGQHSALHRLCLAERCRTIEIPGHPDFI